MAAKKKRLPRKSEAPVAPSVSPALRKKRDAFFTLLRDQEIIEELQEKLAEANEQIKSGEVALLEMAKVVSVLNRGLAVEREKLAAAERASGERLQAIQKLTDERARDRRADFAEFTYWKGEVERLHHELLEIHRERAREAVNPLGRAAASPPSDDSKDIEALQDHALRGGVA